MSGIKEDKVLQLATSKLQALSCELDKNAKVRLQYAYKKSVFEIMAICGISKLDEPLLTPLVDMTVGYFLQESHAIKYLSLEDTDKIIKSISEGDISISYETGNLDEIFKNYYGSLITTAKSSLVRFRRLSW